MRLSLTYKITHSTSRTIVGIGSQIQDFSRTHNVPQKLYFYQGENGKFDDDIEFPVYRMESKAKLTDLINNVPLVDNLMISIKCFRLFESLILPEFQTFPLKFIYKGHLIEDYHAFSIVKDLKILNFISWEHSRFFKTKGTYENKIEEYSFRSIEAFLEAKNVFSQSGFGIRPEVKLTYHNDYDIVNFGRYPMPLGFLCSQKARDSILDAGLTGFDFEALPDELFL